MKVHCTQVGNEYVIAYTNGKVLLKVSEKGIFKPNGRHLANSNALYAVRVHIEDIYKMVFDVVSENNYGNAKYFLKKVDTFREERYIDGIPYLEETSKRYKCNKVIRERAYNFYLSVIQQCLVCIDILLTHKDMPELETLVYRHEYSLVLAKLYCKTLIKGTAKDRQKRIALAMRMVATGECILVSYKHNVVIPYNKSMLKYPYYCYGYNVRAADYILKPNNPLYLNDRDVAFLARNGMDTNDYAMARSIALRFEDYLSMCQRYHHDITDDYWRHNRNWEELHDEFVARHSAEMDKPEAEYIKERYSKFDGIVYKQDDYEVRTSSDANEWRDFADNLHQCILANRYFTKNTIIIFVFRNGKPYGTCEYEPASQKVIQQYRDEHKLGTFESKLTAKEVRMVTEFARNNKLCW